MLFVMTDEQTPTPPTGTVGFQTKAPRAEDYCYNEASVYIPFEADPDDLAATDREARLAMAAAQKIVFDAAGTEYKVEYDDDGTEQVIALLEQTFGPGVVTRVVDKYNREVEQQQAPETDPRPHVQAGSVKVLKQLEQAGSKVAVPDWLEAQYDYYTGRADGFPAGKERAVWDNRKFLPEFGGNGNPKSPWFRTTGKEGEPGAGIGIWPPRKR